MDAGNFVAWWEVIERWAYQLYFSGLCSIQDYQKGKNYIFQSISDFGPHSASQHCRPQKYIYTVLKTLTNKTEKSMKRLIVSRPSTYLKHDSPALYCSSIYISSSTLSSTSWLPPRSPIGSPACLPLANSSYSHSTVTVNLCCDVSRLPVNQILHHTCPPFSSLSQNKPQQDYEPM